MAPLPSKMHRVPGGRFSMGCAQGDAECDHDEVPRHDVSLANFCIDVTEVTVAQYRGCVDAAACTPPNSDDGCNWERDDRGNHPINCVDWNQATSYCQWAHKRLPTEAEWEKAARGTDGRIFPWGNEEPSCDRAVLALGGDGCGRGGTWPVGSLPSGSSPHGVHDMAGNVWEWVSDYYAKDYYARSPAHDPAGPTSGTARTYRGAAWSYGCSSATRSPRASARCQTPPRSRYYNLGFRCAADAPAR